jgi:hypothetical protein
LQKSTWAAQDELDLIADRRIIEHIMKIQISTSSFGVCSALLTCRSQTCNHCRSLISFLGISNLNRLAVKSLLNELICAADIRSADIESSTVGNAFESLLYRKWMVSILQAVEQCQDDISRNDIVQCGAVNFYELEENGGGIPLGIGRLGEAVTANWFKNGATSAVLSENVSSVKKTLVVIKRIKMVRSSKNYINQVFAL